MDTTELHEGQRYWKDYEKIGFKLVPVKLRLNEKREKEFVNPLPWKEKDYSFGNYKRHQQIRPGIAVKTGLISGVFVIDEDTQNSLKRHGINDNDLQNIPCVKTQNPDHGPHYWFKWPSKLAERIDLTRTNKKEGIDLRGEGGLVFAPSTKVAGGGAYEWRTLIPPEGLPQLPQKLQDALIKLFPKQPEISDIPKESMHAKQPTKGQRVIWNDEVKKYLQKYPGSQDRSGLDYRLACIARDFRIPIDEFVATAKKPERAKCKDKGHTKTYLPKLIAVVYNKEDLDSLLDRITVTPPEKKDQVAKPVYRMIGNLDPAEQEHKIGTLKKALGGVSVRVIRSKIRQAFYTEADEVENEKEVFAKSLKDVSASTLKEVLTTFKKWLELEETDYIEIALATVLSTRLAGDPVWVFIVGPPGATKTEILRAFEMLPQVWFGDSLTEHTLVSNFENVNPITKERTDPSLLPKLDQKTLILKDFTVILGLKRDKRMVIFSQFRSSYDGFVFADSGGGVGHKKHKAHYSLIAGVTPIIDKYGAVTQNLGERFLKVRLGSKDTKKKVKRALQNEPYLEEMRRELLQILYRFYKNNFVKPELPETLEEKLVNLAEFVAFCRTTVSRSSYGAREVNVVPEPEVGTRLVIQFTKLVKSLAAIRGKTEVTQDEFAIVERVGIDTLSKKTRNILLALKGKGSVELKDIVAASGVGAQTCRLALQDLEILKIVEEQTFSTPGSPTGWRLTPKIEELISTIQTESAS